MPFERPTVDEVVGRLEASFETEFGVGTFLRRAVVKILARVVGGAIYLLYAYIQFISEQCFILTADGDYLDRHGSEWGMARTAASKATGTGAATGLAGTVIPAGTELASSDGTIYVTDAIATIPAGLTVNIDITAHDAGADGNDDGGIILSFVSPIAGLNTAFTVDADGLAGGSDLEADEDYRDRLLARKRYVPHAGTEYDYEAWCLEYSGVTRVWVHGSYMGAGTIGIAFMRDDDTTPIPNSSQMTAVKNYLISHSDPETGDTVGCPLTAEPGLMMITLTALAVDFDVDIYPNTSAVQTAVTTEIEDLILNVGGSGQTIRLSDMYAAINQAAGLEYWRLNSPAADSAASYGQVHTKGTVTFGDY